MLFIACGEKNKNDTYELKQASINITSGGAKVCILGDDVFTVTSEGIKKFRLNSGSFETADLFTTDFYSDICAFSGKIYAISDIINGVQKLVVIDPKSRETSILREFNSEYGSVWFKNIIGDTLYVYDNGLIYAVDRDGSVQYTGYNDPAMICDEGVFTNTDLNDHTGFMFVPDDKKSGMVIEYPKLEGRPVNASFINDSKVFIVVDQFRPAFVTLGDPSGKVTYLDIRTEEKEIKNSDIVSLSYLRVTEQLIISVAEYEPDTNMWNWDVFSNNLDSHGSVISGGRKYFHFENEMLPLCWVSALDYHLFASGIDGVREEWYPLMDEMK